MCPSHAFYDILAPIQMILRGLTINHILAMIPIILNGLTTNHIMATILTNFVG